MTCPYCGEAVTPGSRYCLHCGTRQEPEYTYDETLEILQETPVVTEPPVEPANLEAAKPAATKAPRKIVNKLRLPTKRGLGKMFFLGILTAGIYPTVIWSRITTELNIVAGRHDGRRTMPFFGMIILSPVTLGILPWVWMHNFCCRVGDELKYRRINYQFGPKDFWLWNILSSLILVGPFIFTHKLMKSMNLLNDDFNRRG